jgi:hypothetical protein
MSAYAETSPSQRDIDADYAERLIAHRCPELGEMPSSALAPDSVPAEVLDRVLDVVLAIEARLARLEERA